MYNFIYKKYNKKIVKMSTNKNILLNIIFETKVLKIN